MAKILLVEDNEMNRDMLSRRLIKKGFEVDMAIDGEEGYNKGKLSDYNVILMDMSLPKMDGWEITQKLRSEGIKTPIIANIKPIRRLKFNRSLGRTKWASKANQTGIE